MTKSALFSCENLANETPSATRFPPFCGHRGEIFERPFKEIRLGFIVTALLKSEVSCAIADRVVEFVSESRKRRPEFLDVDDDVVRFLVEDAPTVHRVHFGWVNRIVEKLMRQRFVACLRTFEVPLQFGLDSVEVWTATNDDEEIVRLK